MLFRILAFMVSLACPLAALADPTQDTIRAAVADFHEGDFDMLLGSARRHDRLADGLDGRYVRFFASGDRLDGIDDVSLAAQCERAPAEFLASRDGFAITQSLNENGATKSMTTRFVATNGRFYTFLHDVAEEAAYYGLPVDDPKKRLYARTSASGLAFVVKPSADVVAIRFANAQPRIYLRCGVADVGAQLKAAGEQLFGGLDPQYFWNADHVLRQAAMEGDFTFVSWLSGTDDAPDASTLAASCQKRPVKVTTTPYAMTLTEAYKSRTKQTRFALRPDGLYTVFTDPDETLAYLNPAYRDIDATDPFISETVRYLAGTANISLPHNDVIVLETELLSGSLLVRCPK